MTQEINAPDTRYRLAAAAGIGGVAAPVLGLAILPIWAFPATTSSGVQITAFVAGHRSALQAVMLCNTVGVGLWMIFGTGVWLQIRAARGERSAAAACFGFGLVGFVTLLMAAFVAFDVLVYRPSAPPVARLLYDLTFGLLAMSGVPTAIALGAYAVATLSRLRPWRVSGLLAAVASVAHVLLLGSFVASSGFFSLEGPVIVVVPALLFGWILATGIELADVAHFHRKWTNTRPKLSESFSTR